MKKLFILFVTIFFLSPFCLAQTRRTAHSLFWCSDSLQVTEIVSDQGDLYEQVGHHGPAVENSHMALCLYFNDSGAIDVYSKNARGMELRDYSWYPSDQQQADYGLGHDAYNVGNTLGFGGIALWDGAKEVRLVATKGRTARVGETKKGDFAEVIAYGVVYAGDKVDVSIRIDMDQKSRVAKLTAVELSGKKVQFITGLNFHEGQKVSQGDGYVSVWGAHPEISSLNVLPVGAGLFYSTNDFPVTEKRDDMVRLISKPTTKITTRLISSSTLEAELNSARRFETFMSK